MNKFVISILCIFSVGIFSAHVQEVRTYFEGTIYVVRHGEKDTVGGNNPKLSVAGFNRAGALRQRLQDLPITQIYSTKYFRTMMTADSLRIQKKLDSFIYVPDQTGAGLQSALMLHFVPNSTVVVVAHSNTIPAILKMLGVQDVLPNELPETEYDNLFIVTTKNKQVVLQREKYGVRSTR